MSQKIAVVTGSSCGIGKAICLMLLDEGYKVYGIARSKGDIEDQNFVHLAANLTDPNCFDELSKQVKEQKIDLLINNAGVFIGGQGLEFQLEEYEQTFRLNFLAPILLTNALKLKLKDSLIINVISLSDRIAGEDCGLYCASKAALSMYFACVALEEKDKKILSILPSYVDTPMLRAIMNQGDGEPPFKWEDILQPNDLADLVKLILSKPEEYISGEKLFVVNNSLLEDVEEWENVRVYNASERKVVSLEGARRLKHNNP